MTDEVQIPAEVDPAPVQEATVAPDAEVQTPEDKPVEEQKTFTQEELDAAIGKRLAREQRKWEREQAAKTAEAQIQQAPPKVALPEQFESTEAYAEALALQKAEELLAHREQQKERARIVEAYHDREEDARAKYDDFEQVAYNPKIRITDVMAQTIQSSDIGPDVAYYLGSNPKEADRISRLQPFLQAKEIGRIEASLASDPPKKTTSAPAPLKPIAARSSGGPAYDTTDPRSITTMTTSQWIEAERARQIRKFDAQRNR